MKKALVLTSMLATLFSPSSPACAEDRAGSAHKSEVTSPAAPRESPATREQVQERQRMIQSLQQQIDALKASYQSYLDELQAIHARAVREKAAETAKQIETIMSRRAERYQNQVQPLEQELQRLRSTMQERAPGAATARPGKHERGPARGRKAPDFELDSFDGRTVKLSDYEGSIVVLEWLNTDCPHVRYHYERGKTMVNLAKKYRSQNVVWLALNSTSQTTPEANREFAKKYGLSYPILDDRTGEVGRLYGAIKTPHVFVIDRDGGIVYDGAIDNAPPGKPQAGGKRANYVDKALTELLSGQKVSLPATPPYGTAVGYPAVRR